MAPGRSPRRPESTDSRYAAGTLGDDVIARDRLKDSSTLGGTLKGRVLRPGEPGYDEARTVWKAMIDRRPALIVRCALGDDVPAALRFARDHRFEVSIRDGMDGACMAWARAFFKASAPYASAGAYVHFMTADEGERVVAAYGPNYTRLVQGSRLPDRGCPTFSS